MAKSASCAQVVHTFCPLTTHSSPSRTAFVASDARSEPAPGSLKSWHHFSSLRTIGAEEAQLLLVGAVREQRGRGVVEPERVQRAEVVRREHRAHRGRGLRRHARGRRTPAPTSASPVPTRRTPGTTPRSRPGSAPHGSRSCRRVPRRRATRPARAPRPTPRCAPRTPRPGSTHPLRAVRRSSPQRRCRGGAVRHDRAPGRCSASSPARGRRRRPGWPRCPRTWRTPSRMLFMPWM